MLLFETPDLHGLGRMADFVKSRLHGERVFFVMNRYVNPTNVCVLSCSFCDIARKKGEEGAFELDVAGKPRATHRAGDSFLVEGGRVHAGKNIAPGPSRLLVTVILEKGQPPSASAK